MASFFSLCIRADIYGSRHAFPSPPSVVTRSYGRVLKAAATGIGEKLKQALGPPKVQVEVFISEGRSLFNLSSASH